MIEPGIGHGVGALEHLLCDQLCEPQQFQLFHPIGGVSAIVSPMTILSGFSSVPRSFLAWSVTLNSPAVFDDAGYASGVGVDLQSIGKTIRAEGQRPIARGRHGVKERPAGTLAINSRPIDAQRGGHRWRENIARAGTISCPDVAAKQTGAANVAASAMDRNGLEIIGKTLK